MEKKVIKEDFGLERFKQINKYAVGLLGEQTAPPTPPPPADLPPVPGAEPAGAPAPAGDAAAPAADPNASAGAAGDAAAPGAGAETPEADDTTEEIDMTDLVNMVKDVKKQLDTPQQNPEATQKMDAVFSKLGELEAKLGEMDNVLAKIDQLGTEVQQMKPKTPIEKLEMRSLDSYPFSQKPDEFFKEKQDEMKRTGKNEYVLTKGDVENYGKYDVMKSFNPNANASTNQSDKNY